MGSKNDGLGMGPEFYGRQPGQDRKDFPLGTSRAVPAPGYFADARGLANEQVIKDAVAGLADAKEIEAVLTDLLRSGQQARDFIWYRLKMRK